MCLGTPAGPVRIILSLYRTGGRWYYRTRDEADPTGPVVPMPENCLLRCDHSENPAKTHATAAT